MGWTEISYKRSQSNGRPLNDMVALSKTRFTSTITFPAGLLEKEFVRVFQERNVFSFVPSDDFGLKVYHPNKSNSARISRKLFFDFKKGRYAFNKNDDGSIIVEFKKKEVLGNDGV